MVLCHSKHMFGEMMAVSPRTYERAVSLEAELLRNLDVSRKDGKITIVIDESKDLGASKSGKTNLVASSGGFVAIAGCDVALNVTATRPTS